MRSIRRGLLGALLGTLLAAVAVATALTYRTARAEIDALLDEELRQVALSLRDHAFLDVEKLNRSAAAPEQRLLVQIDDERRPEPYRSREVAPLPPAAGDGWGDLEHAGQGWRVYTLAGVVQTIRVAQPLAQRREQALTITLRIVWPLLALLPLAAALVWWSVGRALRPLHELENTLAQRSPAALAPLAANELPVELQPLVGALNGLLARLESAFAQQKGLAADAAHALRTPLAALTLQAQLAQRASDADRLAALQRLEQGVKRATHLVQQLLTLARLDPDAAQQPFAPVDLAALVQEVADELAPLAQAKEIALHVAAQPTTVPALADALQMALVNLVDNAIRYTPAGGRIELRVQPGETGVTLAVLDNGPGVPEEEYERVFDRFYRGRDAAAGGSGLGLAIVRQVVALHGCTVAAGPGLDGRGFGVRLSFPVGSANA
jgi:two-component system OmpR family sensor kinase